MNSNFCGHSKPSVRPGIRQKPNRKTSTTEQREPGQVYCPEIWIARNFNLLTRRFPTVLYALVPAGAKFAYFGVRELIVRDCEIVECRG